MKSFLLFVSIKIILKRYKNRVFFMYFIFIKSVLNNFRTDEHISKLQIFMYFGDSGLDYLCCVQEFCWQRRWQNCMAMLWQWHNGWVAKQAISRFKIFFTLIVMYSIVGNITREPKRSEQILKMRTSLKIIFWYLSNTYSSDKYGVLYLPILTEC